MDMYKNNNRGFSLVELIVSFAILALVSIAIIGMMATGMRFFTNSSNRVGLQNDYQNVMTMLREYAVDANAGIAWDEDENELYLVYSEEIFTPAPIPGDPPVWQRTEYITHVFAFDDATQELSYARSAIGINAPPALPVAFDIVSTRVTAFDIDIDPDSDKRAIVTIMEFVENRRPDARAYAAEQTIAMRNTVHKAVNDAVTGDAAYDVLCDLIAP